MTEQMTVLLNNPVLTRSFLTVASYGFAFSPFCLQIRIQANSIGGFVSDSRDFLFHSPKAEYVKFGCRRFASTDQ
jgi:hypothetical protein